MTNSEKKFTHLHLHTSYSLLDGAIRPKELMRRVKELGMDSVAMTDHGNMYGAIDFYKAARAEGVNPIIGLEFYIAPGSMKDTRQVDRLADGNNYHLVVLASNNKGYENLIRLASRSFSEGFYRKPRIDYDLLSQYSEGLIGSSACIAGEIQSKILSGKEDEALNLAGKLSDIFGKDRFYLEIQRHGIPEEDIAARGVADISKRTGIPMVLTNDSHYLKKEDREAQDILLRINQNKKINDPLYFGFNDQFYVKSPEEMFALYPEYPEAFYNTQKIASMVDINFEFGNPLLPKYEVPAGENLNSHMERLALEGLHKRYGSPLREEVLERFKFEIDVINGMDFPGYFLIVQDFINWAKQNGVPVGPGRGSAAGSIVAFGLGITDIDPLKYDLLFERFLNPDRKEMPDIDVDFCTERREEVINYVRNKYGADHVGQIITYGKMAAKACLKDVARVLDIPYDESNAMTKKFPDVLNISIDEALEQSKELKTYAESGDIQKNLFSVARKLEGNVRHTGVHAAGVVIAPRPLEELVPMATVAAKGGDRSGERVLVSQYDMTALTDVGLVKMDFLGLRNLTIIDHALQEIKRRHNTFVDFDTISQDDKATYELLQRGDVAGVFQLESSGMREFVLRTKPGRFEDIIALIALYRPGPLDSGMAESFINRKKGIEKVIYPHADLEPVLRDTYGVIVYQEQVMLISRVIGDFSPGESDALRKAMGKKKADIVEQMKVKFMEGARRKNYDLKMAEHLYDQMAEFAKYGFNKSHSAAYAMIVYRTAYLKANYPTEYMMAVLDSEIDRTERLVFYLGACRDMGIKILGPDINESYLKFTTTPDGDIRFGLNAIKNVGVPAAESIVRERESNDGSFKDFTTLLENVDLRLCNKRTVESLIHAGAFDSLKYSRKALMESLEMVFSHAQKAQSDKATGQESLFGSGTSGGMSSDLVPRGEDVIDYPEQELLQKEKEVLGFYFSGHPLARFEHTLKSIKSTQVRHISSLKHQQKVEVACVVTSYSIRPTKTGREMCSLELEDTTGTISGLMFSRALENSRANLVMDVPVFIRASVEKKEETGTTNLLVEEIRQLNQEILEEKLERSLHLVIEKQGLNSNSLKNLQTVLNGYRGPLTVFFHLVDHSGNGNGERTVIRAHQSFGVNYTRDMIDRLKSMSEIRGIHLTVGDQMRTIWKSESAEIAS